MTRMELLNAKIARDERLKTEKEKIAQEKRWSLVTKVTDLKTRIHELMELGEALRSHGYIKNDWEAGAPGFFADGFNHCVGFMGHGAKIEFIGFYNGGACGPWDFYTDGVAVFNKHSDTDKTDYPSTVNLQTFLKGFEKFEKSFYEAFDKAFGEENN